MSNNVTRGDFVFDYVVARPRPRVDPGRLAMAALIIVLLAALATTVLRPPAGDPQGDAANDIVMQGP